MSKNVTIEEQVKTYCKQMEEEKALHKSNDGLKNAIKKWLVDAGMTMSKIGNYKVVLQSRVTESVDETKMIGVLKAYWDKHGKGKQCPFIGTKEYVDMDALESYIYRGKLPKYLLLELDECRVKKESTALTYKVEKDDKSVSADELFE